MAHHLLFGPDDQSRPCGLSRNLAELSIERAAWSGGERIKRAGDAMAVARMRRMDQNNATVGKAAGLPEELEGLRAKLELASRQASMAEVATGALHNVGNVLTSLNVSATVLGNRLRHSRVNNLAKALALLRERRADLAAFLADDPKGKLLPSYLETLADHLAAEQAEMLREFEHLSRNLEHVKEIVAVQQSYARQCGVLEVLPVVDLVEDAIRMNLGAFERHGIRIVCEFKEVPPVKVDRHKVLQILINLMRNAKYAMDELGPPEKRLVMSIGCNEEGMVFISVRDNGIGIAPEHLRRIFEHGFTTKRDGHGFGLHSGSLAARDLGGSLTASSPGIGQGATFTLELPVARTEERAIEHGNRAAHSVVGR